MTGQSPEPPKAVPDISGLGDDLVAYLSYRAGEYADERIRHREERRQTLRTIALSLVAVIGIGAISYVVNIALENIIEGKFQELNEENRRRMDQAVALVQFIDIASRIAAQETRVSDESAKSVISLLQKLKQTKFEPAEGVFLQSLEIAIDALWGSELFGILEKIDDLHQDLMIGADGIVFTMVNHYGTQVVGALGEILESADSDKRFAVYERAARVGNYPELSIFWRLLIAFRQNASTRSTVTDELIESIDYLRDEDRDFFLTQLAEYSDPERFETVPRPEDVKVALTITALLEAYPLLAGEIARLPAAEEPSAHER